MAVRIINKSIAASQLLGIMVKFWPLFLDRYRLVRLFFRDYRTCSPMHQLEPFISLPYVTVPVSTDSHVTHRYSHELQNHTVPQDFSNTLRIFGKCSVTLNLIAWDVVWKQSVFFWCLSYFLYFSLLIISPCCGLGVFLSLERQSDSTRSLEWIGTCGFVNFQKTRKCAVLGAYFNFEICSVWCRSLMNNTLGAYSLQICEYLSQIQRETKAFLLIVRYNTEGPPFSDWQRRHRILFFFVGLKNRVNQVLFFKQMV